MKKQILTVLFLCLLLIVTLLLVACNDTGNSPTPDEPGNAAGTDDSGNTQPPSDTQKASEGLQYTFADDGSGYIVVGIGTCSDSEIVIPAVYQDKPVVKLAGGLFRGKTYITGVVLPNSITDIGYSAFSGCTSLTNITFQGTKARWNQISKDYDWNAYTGNYTIHCTDGNIAKQ